MDVVLGIFEIILAGEFSYRLQPVFVCTVFAIIIGLPLVKLPGKLRTEAIIKRVTKLSRLASHTEMFQSLLFV